MKAAPRAAWPTAAAAACAQARRTLAAVATCAIGCAAPRSPSPPSLQPVARPAAEAAMAAQRAAEAARAPARSYLLGTLAHSGIGPFEAHSPEGGLAAWVAPQSRGGPKLMVVPLGADGSPLSDPKALADVPTETTSLVVRSPGGPHAGWLVAWSALRDRGESLTVLGVAPDGTARAASADVQQTADHIQWLDLVPTAHGAACVWAEEATSGEANILVAPIDSDGRPRGLPQRVARGVRGWATAPAGDGAGIALVLPPASSGAPPPVNASNAQKSTGAGTLSWLRLDAGARPVGPPVAIATRPTVSSDVDVVPSRGGWVFGWTDRTGEDAQVMLASVDAAGHVHPPHRALDAVGGTLLVALASGPAGIALAWEEPHGRARPMRRLSLARVSAEEAPVAQTVGSLEIDLRTAPDLEATQSGFAVLAGARACLAGKESAPCAGPVVPSFVRFDAHGAPVQTEPFFLGEGSKDAALGWGLRCSGDHCVALAATAEAPTPVYAVDLAPRAAPFRAPLTPALPPAAPRVAGVATLASGQPFIDVAAARVGSATFIASLAIAADLASDRLLLEGAPPPSLASSSTSSGKRRAPRLRDRGRAREAVLTLRAVDDDGLPLSTPATLSSRAMPIGGVAIAPAARTEDGAAVAWVAREGDVGQVHVARVDPRARRSAEITIALDGGNASDVAVTWAGDGWVVAWVDSRDGRGDLYALKLDRSLRRVARIQRIRRAPGDAADVALAGGGDTVWLAWSDTRESPDDGVGDVYVTTLDARSAQRTGDDVRVLATAAHSRSPQIIAAGDGAIVAWIEAAPTGLDAPGAAMVARLSQNGHVVGAPEELPLSAPGRPTTIALASPSGHGVRAIVARSARDEVTIDAVALGPSGAPLGRAWRILDLDAPPSFDVALALAHGALVYDDVGGSPGERRVRRAAVLWPH